MNYEGNRGQESTLEPDQALIENRRKQILGRFAIPSRLLNMLSQATWIPVPLGGSNMEMYEIHMARGSQTFLLKIAITEEAMKELIYESDILTIIEPYDIGPKLYYMDVEEDMALSVREFVKGMPIMECSLDMKVIGSKVAHLLRYLHQLEVHNVVIHTLEERIAMAEDRVRHGLVAAEDFEAIYLGMSPEDLWKQFENMPINVDKEVLTHGDFTFANMICSENGTVKLIDWGRTTLGDAYIDLGLMIRDLKEIENEQEQKDFLGAFQADYELDHLDQEKIDYFVCMDEFF